MKVCTAMAACTVLTVLHTCRPGCLVATRETSRKRLFQYPNGSSRLYVRHANQQWLSSCYCHEAAVPDHPLLSSDPVSQLAHSLCHHAVAQDLEARFWGVCNTGKPPANQQKTKQQQTKNKNNTISFRNQRVTYSSTRM